ncbi:MAG: TIGR04348 family glycosyltransferase [Acidobacteriia bacterium]|nr:TIGR04348 family glycosyltransferase [Terriglobia bacterium]
MRIGIVTPSPPRSHYGNSITALRWARILKGLGHRVRLAQGYKGERYDLMIALHARRSYSSVRGFHRDYPDRPLVVALTGTDLYRDLPRSRTAQESLKLATRIVALQPMARRELQPPLRKKLRIIYQSVTPTIKIRRISAVPQSPRNFDVCVIAHLRAIKDPFRAALAARRLPSSSRLRIFHLGAAMTKAMARRARRETGINPRYHWLGDRPRRYVERTLARSALCVLSSGAEGGANVLGEAIVAGVPLLASRIPGSVGILGEEYSGYFSVGNTEELARLFIRTETDPKFLARLRSQCAKLAPLFSPVRERDAWRRLIEELGT